MLVQSFVVVVVVAVLLVSVVLSLVCTL